MKRATVLIAMLCTAAGLLAAQASATDAAPAATERLQTLEQGILSRLNTTRAARGLRPLTLSDDLQHAALAHSRSMLEAGFFEHESKDGSPFYDRVKRYYASDGFNQWSVGENLLYTTGEITAEQVIKAWLDSPSHRENMLSPAWREVGIGAVDASSAGGTFGGEQTLVITMDFGSRSGGNARKLKPKPKAKYTSASPRVRHLLQPLVGV